jgi:integrase
MADRITQKLILKLIPPPAGNSIEYDSEIPGFGVRITAAGAIAFILNYRFRGRERRITIGRYPELTVTAARERAIQFRGRILDGHDPLQERESERAEPTVADLAAHYMSDYAEKHKRPTSLRNDRQMIDKIIIPKLGKLRLKSVGVKDIAAVHTSLENTPYRANRVLALLSKMFSLAGEWGWRADNPARKVPHFHEDRRENWLSIEQIRLFTTALNEYQDQNAANALRLLLLTGARVGELLSADWTQFDLERGIWTKPSHHTKQKKTEHIPLSPPAIDLLNKMKPKILSGPLFPGAKGGPRTTLRRPWIQACKAAGLVEEVEFQGKRKVIKLYKPTIRIHDLRHTYASHLVSTGTSLQIVGKLLGHTQPQTTARYAHVADDALRKATERFGAIFES